MKKTLKNVGLVLLVALAIAMFALAVIRSSETITYTATIGTTTPIESLDEQEKWMREKAPETKIEQAQRMLAEATAKLNDEETKLLEEKAQIEAEAAAKVAEIEAKIEQINQVRLGFTTTVGQQQSSTQ